MTYVRILLILGCMLTAAPTVTAGERPCDRGAFIIDGDLLLSHVGGRDAYGRDGVTIGAVQATVGRFMTDHFMLGLGASAYFNSRSDFQNQWSLGPIVGVYLDPAAERDRVKGAFLPFVRAFFFLGNPPDYVGDAQYRAGGDFGITAMVDRTVGLELSFRISKEWVTTSPDWDGSFLGGSDSTTRSGTTILVGLGLTGFLF